MGHFEVSSEQYSPNAGIGKLGLILLVVGVLIFGAGVALNMEYPARIWGALLYNTYFFLGIGLAATFFVASQTVGYNGWFILVKRVSEAMGSIIPIGAILLAIVLFFGFHSLYHWSHEGLNDELIDGKRPFLNSGLFWTLTTIYLVGYSLFWFLIRRNSIQQDKTPSPALYERSKPLSILYLVLFGVASSTAIWHWIMSIDPHWYSTLFGWYCFISIFVTCQAVTALVAWYLKSMGYLKYVTQEHFHDLGKYMFAFSVAWTYLWISQFMLIWYANIPEETKYFADRWDHYKPFFYLNWIINFICPFFFLMMARGKRNMNFLAFAALFIIIGHWIDYFLMVMPGVILNNHYTDSHGHQIGSFGIGLPEIGLFLTYAGLFITIVFRSLSKASLVPTGHPFIKESLTHHT